MKKKLLFILLFNIGVAEAASINLDFVSGIYSDEKGTIDVATGNPFPSFNSQVDTYTQNGFELTTQAIGNHLDKSYIGNIGFHNGPANPSTDNNLILSFSGGEFDLTSIDFQGFLVGGLSLDLLGSNGASESITALGANSLSFFNVTSIVFSVTGASSSDHAAGWDSLEVNSTPSAVPAPAAIWLLGSGLIGLVGMRKKSAKLSGKYA